MDPRFLRFPEALASKARLARLGPTGIPALLAHPDWSSPAPTVLWLHGRTVNKELDPGRYLRWIRAGMAACAIDLPGHGERLEPALHAPESSLDLLARAVPEIDLAAGALADPRWSGCFDADRLAVGGMSAGGMAVLRRLCDPHSFACAAVECTTGWLQALYRPESLGLPAGFGGRVRHDPDRVAPLDPMQHMRGFKPIPLLALHTEADRLIPIGGMRRYLDALREHYTHAGADPSMIELRTWPETGAPDEHAGFGRFGNDAKNAQLEFLARRLRGSA